MRVNQLSAMLFKSMIGHHDPPRIPIPPHFQCIYHAYYFEPLCLSLQPQRWFPLLRFPPIIPVIIRCSSFFLFNKWPKKVVWLLCFLFMSDFIMSDSRNTILFDFFAVLEICSILRRNHISIASSFFCNCFKTVQALHLIHQNGFVDKWTLIVLTNDHYFCLFAIPFQSFFASFFSNNVL